MQQRARQGVGLRVARFGQFGQGRAAWVAQAQQLGGFVKGFASGIVNGFAQQGVAGYAIYAHELGVPARYQERHKGELWRVGA